MNKILGAYMNGNTRVTLMSDGTRIRETEDDEFKEVFPNSIDCCITRRCDNNCQFCYEGCSTDGEHADIMNQAWVDTLHPYTEIAINGNDLSHPYLLSFLEKLKAKKVVANMTVNQNHFMKNLPLLHVLTDNELIHGLGVSLVNPTEEFIKEVKKFPNAIIHVINGLLTKKDIDALKDKGLKILILGYKTRGRGIDYLQNHMEGVNGNMQWLRDHLTDVCNSFKVICFDNLALEQLDVKSLLTEEEWTEFYSGDDGSQSMYIDAVNRTFSKNSIATSDKRYPLEESIDTMFTRILDESIK